MLNEMGGYTFVAFKAGEHERSPPINVFCLFICTCSECNATNDTTRHPLHVDCYSYEEEFLSTVSQSTTHYKSHYIHNIQVHY